MFKREITHALEEVKQFEKAWVQVDDYGEGKYQAYFLGSFLSLDPCGRYHHILSPNGITKKCETFWDELNQIAENLGGWIESGEGNPLDTFFCLPLE